MRFISGGGITRATDVRSWPYPSRSRAAPARVPRRGIGRHGAAEGHQHHEIGHASPETTLRRYSHWVRPEQEDMSFLRLVEAG
jgi:hypothetical protein